jgi:hypothetical protein
MSGEVAFCIWLYKVLLKWQRIIQNCARPRPSNLFQGAGLAAIFNGAEDLYETSFDGGFCGWIRCILLQCFAV